MGERLPGWEPVLEVRLMPSGGGEVRTAPFPNSMSYSTGPWRLESFPHPQGGGRSVRLVVDLGACVGEIAEGALGRTAAPEVKQPELAEAIAGLTALLREKLPRG